MYLPKCNLRAKKKKKNVVMKEKMEIEERSYIPANVMVFNQ